MSNIGRDIRFSLRVLVKNPGFAIVAVLTLAVGIAVNSTVFGWIDSVLWHAYPGVGHPGQLALIETVTPDGEYLVNTSYLDYLDYRDNLRSVSGLAIGRFTPISMGADGSTERAWAELVSANYFSVLEVEPVLGRAFLPEEASEPGGAPVAVISNRMWRNRFNADPNILGRSIRLNRHELTIVGVAPPEFRGTTVGLSYDLWVPITMAAAMGTGGGTLTYRGTRDLTSTIARLEPGVTLDQARAEVAALAGRLETMYPDTNRGVRAVLAPVWKGHLGAQGLLLKPLQILMAVCLLLLLIVCANVANLLLARAVSRQKEFGIRLALGAGRLRLTRQLLTETLLLAGAGSLVAVVGVLWLGPSLALLLPPMDIPLDLGSTLNLPVLGFTALIAVAATLVSGLAPALLSARTDLNETLKEGGRGGGAGVRSHRLRSALVTAEVALAMVALAGAGLFFRSFHNAGNIEPGFDMTNVSVSQFYLSYAGYSAEEQHAFCRTLRQRLEEFPGVVGVTYSDFVPLGSVAGSAPWHQIEVEGYVPGPNEQTMIHRATVPPGYFDLLGIRLISGRDFTERDRADAPRVVIVNETFARRFFAGADPIGRKVGVDSGSATVVGLVADSRYHTPMETPMPFFYLPFEQRFAPGLNFSVLIKTTGDPLRFTPDLRREALALNQDAVFDTRLYTDLAMSSLYPQKVAASLLSVVAAVCLLLSAIGLYSVMSYVVSQRSREMGIRIAVGARPFHIVRLVTVQGLKMTVLGLLAGLAAALAAARVASGMLVGVGTGDPFTFLTVTFLVALVAFVASSIPALRASSVDPATAVRVD